jgi:hypothetical protein
VTPAQSDTWKKFTSAEGKFSVILPCTPAVSSEELKDTSVEQVFHGCASATAVYQMSYTTLEPLGTSRATLDSFRDGVARGANTTISDEKEISISSYPGRAFSIEATAGTMAIHYDWRIFLVGKRIYSLGFAMRKGESDPAAKERFFSSFVLGN